MSAGQYWILVGSPENLEATRAHGFRLQGFKSRHRKKAESMRPGDRLVYYVTGVQGFAATVTVTSDAFEDHTPIWTSRGPKKASEDYPWRVQIEPDIVLPPGLTVPAEQLAPLLEHTQKWPPEHWRLAFQGQLHRISERDFTLIRQALAQAAAVSEGVQR
ncbi:EVE domain-containing protein [Thermomicrobium sp. CFH 73360]|uniref:EVE domain-containing protein n=1 Tax=Thermomicrobium sp. CFH 73360 TaxID=2951987 RepID=UPI0020767362|nr:EVE domain-containing protein [Thermomicrobium sp. CFH 73360]